MKKTYIMPEALTVVLGSIRMIAASADLEDNGNGGLEGNLGGDATGPGLTKEISDKNVWDEEW